MSRHFFNRCRSVRRAPLAWALAWLALLLNAIAPVVAYASLATRHLHEHPAAAGPARDASHEHHEHGGHVAQAANHEAHPAAHSHAHHRAGPETATTEPPRPVTPHCQYCPDFAAGAPLSLAMPAGVDPTPQLWAAPFRIEAALHAKPLTRLAWARGPPL